MNKSELITRLRELEENYRKIVTLADEITEMSQACIKKIAEIRAKLDLL